jgi:Penicillin amidase
MGVESARIGITSPWATGARVAGANAGRRGHGRLCRHSSSCASYPGSRRPGTVRFYATSGNTFVSVVEFGPKLRALAMREGGNSGDPDSPHFIDQAERLRAAISGQSISTPRTSRAISRGPTSRASSCAGPERPVGYRGYRLRPPHARPAPLSRRLPLVRSPRIRRWERAWRAMR